MPGPTEAACARNPTISAFEFNSVVISILIALALAEVIASWGRIVKRLPAVSISWLYLAASVLLFLFLIGHWLGLSAYRSIESFSPAQSLLVFSPSFVGALAAFILAPDFRESGRLDLEEHYLRVSAWFFPLLALFVALAALSDVLVLGREVLPTWFYLLRASALLIPAFTKRVLAHALVLIFSVVAPLIFVAISAQ